MCREYYVYEYVRLDTNEPFYIGKGKGSRWKGRNHNRSKHFRNIVNNIPVACVILHDNLTNEEALEYECWYIWQMRDVEGYDLINLTDGGEGVAGYKFTEEELKHHSKINKGENNPMFGKVGSLKGIHPDEHPAATTVYLNVDGERVRFGSMKTAAQVLNISVYKVKQYANTFECIKLGEGVKEKCQKKLQNGSS